MRRLRGAIVGFGRVAAEAHVPGFAAARGFDIVAAVDPAPERQEEARRSFPEATVHESLEALAASPERIDFVDIAAPPRFHAGLVVDSLARGWHVLCEKPLAVDAAGMREVRDAARKVKRAVFTVHNWKYAPLFRRLRGWIGAGRVGGPREIEWSVLRPDPPSGAVEGGEAWRLDRELAGGGILMDHGWHAFYLVLFLTRQSPRTVTARLRHERGLGVEDAAECTIVFDSTMARIHLSWNAPARRTHGIVRGPLGTIEVDDSTLVLRVEGKEPETARFAPPISASSWHPEWFPALLEDFRAEITRPDLRGANLAEAIRCAELMTAAYASNETPVPVGTAEEPKENWK